MESIKKLRGAYYGFVLGDCLGVPFEFKERGKFKAEDIVGYGTYNQPEGTWSDDTSLTLCYMDSLSEEDGLEGTMDRFVEYRDGYMTPFNEMFDIGIATAQSIDNYQHYGKEPIMCGLKGENSNGNGSLMRIMPLPFMLLDKEFDGIFEDVKGISSITHAHPRSIVGCLIYTLIMIELIKGSSLEESIDSVGKIRSKLDGEYLKEFDKYGIIFDEEFSKLSEDSIFSTGYVVHSLVASIWCVLTTESYKSSVLRAVNLGGDTDTIGAITGSISGVLYGDESIPEDWVNKIKNKELVDEVLYKFINHLNEEDLV